MAALTIDPTAVRARFSSLQGGFAFLDAPGGSQVPDSVGDAVARCLREASANMGASYETSRRVGAIVAEAEAKAGAFLGCEPSEIIFGPNMTSLNFTLSRTVGRDFAPGDEILVSSLDHDGGVAPWLELAHDRDLRVQHIELRAGHDARLRRSGGQAERSHARRRVRLGVQRDRHGHRRRAGLRARAQRRRAGLDRRRALRRARADRRRRDRRRRAALLALQVLRPAPRHGLRAHLAARDLASLQGAAGADQPARASLRDRHAALRAARRLQRDDRLPGGDRRHGRDRPLRALARRALPRRAAPTASRSTGCRRSKAACRPSWSTSTARRPPRWRRALGERGIGVWAHNTWYSLNLYQRLGYDGDADPDRLHPLQHRRGGRPARERAGGLRRQS